MTKINNIISNTDLNDIIDLITVRYGYDFSNYAKASLLRRVQRVVDISDIKTVYELKFQLTNNKAFFYFFLQTITVNVTEMFRDPYFYQEMRNNVIPTLATYPSIKIWHAGCSTGEEVYSMCILLKEAGILNRARIYATDINANNLEKAKAGILPLKQMREYTANYIQSGGQDEFSNYYTARYDNAIISKELRKNIIFSPHNLVTDSVFNEFQLICCRNVMIYFDRALQNRVYNLFYESLSPLGFLAIGSKESMLFATNKDKFETISAQHKIYRRNS